MKGILKLSAVLVILGVGILGILLLLGVLDVKQSSMALLKVAGTIAILTGVSLSIGFLMKVGSKG